MEETPKLQLDQAFSTTLAFHQEEDYFDRLTTGSHGPSPYIHNSRSMPPTPEMTSRRISDFDVHSFPGVQSPCLTLSTETHFDNVATPAPIRALHPDESALLSLYTDGRTQLDLSYMGSPVSAMMARQKREKAISETFMTQQAIVETVNSPDDSMEGMSPMEAPTPQPSIFRTMADVSAMMDDSYFVDAIAAETTGNSKKGLSNSDFLPHANQPKSNMVDNSQLVTTNKLQPVVVNALCKTVNVETSQPVVVQMTATVAVDNSKTVPVMVDSSKTTSVFRPRPVVANTSHPVATHQHRSAAITEPIAPHQSRSVVIQTMRPETAAVVEKSKPVAVEMLRPVSAAYKPNPVVDQKLRPVAATNQSKQFAGEKSRPFGAAYKSKPVETQILRSVPAGNKTKSVVAKLFRSVVAQKTSHTPIVVENSQPVASLKSSHMQVVDKNLQPVATADKNKPAMAPTLRVVAVADKSKSVVVENSQPVVSQKSSHMQMQKGIVRPKYEEIQMSNRGSSGNSLASYMISTQSHDKQEMDVCNDTHKTADSLRSKLMPRHFSKDVPYETRDYRNIALSTSESSDIPDIMPLQSNELLFTSPARSNRYTARESPGMESVMSTPGSSPVPLLSRQCLSNAAFLFSPSYTGGNTEQLYDRGSNHSAAFSISTFASRCRLGSVSSRSQPSITIPVATTWDTQSLSRTTFSRTGWSNVEDGTTIEKSLNQNSKHVRFSTADDFYKSDTIDNCAVEKTSLSMSRQFVNPAIETKISDLSDSSGAFSNITFPGGPSRICTQATRVQATRVSVERGGNSWKEHEEVNRVVATPFHVKANIVNQERGENVVPTKSPMIRFRSAKDKFANPEQKKTPAKKTPPKKFWNRTPKKSLISARIADLNNQLTKNACNNSHSQSTNEKSCIQATRSNDEYERTQPSMGFEEMTTKSAPSHFRARTEHVPYDEAPFIKGSVGQSILPATSTASTHSVSYRTVMSAGESDDIFATIRTSSYDLEDLSIPDDESVADDTFANLLAQSTEDEDDNDNDDDETAPTVIRPRNVRPSNQSAAQSSQYTMSTGGSYNTDKENSVRGPSLNSLHKATSTKSQVNPGQVRQHNHHGLYLSPLQRTPLQARKWRSLAAAAQEKEKLKRFQKQGERNVNPPFAYQR